MKDYRLPLSERDTAVLAYLLQAGEARGREIQEALGIPRDKLCTTLTKLRGHGTVVARGRTVADYVYFIRPDLRAAALAQNLLATAERPLLGAPA